MSRRQALILVALAAGIALSLPARPTAVALAGADSPLLGAVVQGVWIWKALLLLHAGLGALLAGRPLTGAPLLALAPADERAVPRAPLVLGGLLALALSLRLIHLGTGLWFDEIQTLVDYVRLPLGRILTTFDSKNQHPLYSVLAHASVGLFGETGWALRLPAALLGAGSLWAVYRCGRAITSQLESVLAVALLAGSYHHVWFSQNARGYTGLLLFTLLGTAAFVRLLTEAPRLTTVVLYACWMALAAYTHITAVFVVVAHGLVWLSLRLRARGTGSVSGAPLIGLCLSATFAMQLYALVLPQFAGTLLAPTMGGTATAWKTPLWFVTETLRVLDQGVPGGLVTVALGAAVGAAGLIGYWRRSTALVGLMLLPVVVSAMAFVAMGQNLWPRFFFFAAGFAVLIAMRGVFLIAGLLLPARLRLVPVAAVALVAVASLLTVPRAWAPKQDYAGAAAYVAAHTGTGDAVVTVDLTTYPYAEYYRERFAAVRSAEELARVEAEHRTTWVLYTFPVRLQAVVPDVWERLQVHYQRDTTFHGTVGGGEIVVMASRTPADSVAERNPE